MSLQEPTGAALRRPTAAEAEEMFAVYWLHPGSYIRARTQEGCPYNNILAATGWQRVTRREYEKADRLRKDAK